MRLLQKGLLCPLIALEHAELNLCKMGLQRSMQLLAHLPVLPA